MSKWWDKSITLVEGCTPVSEGCKHCWSAGMTHRFHKDERFTTDNGVFNGMICCRDDRLVEITKRKKPTRWTIWNDLFHPTVPFEFIDKVMAVIALTPHIYQVLTKRHERMLEYFEDYIRRISFISKAAKALKLPHNDTMYTPDGGKGVYQFDIPIKNLWLGVTAENQAWWEKRKEDFFNIPATVHFVSNEPLLGPIVYTDEDLERLDWVIVGGESGSGARPLHPAWAKSIRDQCKEAGVPFFFKQWGAWGIAEVIKGKKQLSLVGESEPLKPSTPFKCFPEQTDSTIPCTGWIRVGKKKAGCLLDGKEYKEYPK